MSLADSMLLLVFRSKDDKATHARFLCVCVCVFGVRTHRSLLSVFWHAKKKTTTKNLCFLELKSAANADAVLNQPDC